LDGIVHEASEPMPDPVWVVQTAAEALALCGEVLLRGDRVLSGSFVHKPLGRATSTSAAIENLGEVSLTICNAR
jgi:2-keto-4-pentenoate hydratase